MRKRFLITVALALSAAASSVVAYGQGVSAVLPAGRLPGAPNCPMFPPSNAWNRDISKLPVAKNSAQLIAAIGLKRGLHPDFGSYSGYGIPYMVVSGHQHKVPVPFDYADESDKGPYPIPAHPSIEGGPDATGDRHVLLVDRDACRLYELYALQRTGTGWHAGSGAIWNLRSNALRRSCPAWSATTKWRQA